MAMTNYNFFDNTEMNIEQIAMVIPLFDETNIVDIRLAINRKELLIDCQIEMVIPAGNSDASAAIIIKGKIDQVNKVKSMLEKWKRTKTAQLQYHERPESDQAIRIAQNIIIDDDDNSNDNGWLTPPSSPVIDEIKGSTFEVELSQFRSIPEINVNLHQIELIIPLGAIGVVIGFSGRQRLQYLLTTGVQIDAAGLVSEAGGDEHCCVLLSGTDKQILESTKKQIEKVMAKTSFISHRMELEAMAIDALLTFEMDSLRQICEKYGIGLQVLNTELIFHGIQEDLLGKAASDVLKMTFGYHCASVLLANVNVHTSDLHKYLGKSVTASGAEAILQQTNNGTIIVNYYGNQERIEKALSSLYSNVSIIQIKYRMCQNEDLREFVSGKKDGKLIKIMKETGVSIALLPSTLSKQDGQIDIELVGCDPDSISAALQLLTGEFPAELSFYLCESYHKRLIGHGGKTIQRVMKKYAVYIKFLSVNESIDQIGYDVNGTVPRGHVARLHNVIVRTPAKNAPSLQLAKREILEMAEDKEHMLQLNELILNRSNLYKLTGNELKLLAEQFKNYSDNINIQFLASETKHLALQQRLSISGYSAAITKFMDMVNNPTSPVGLIFEKIRLIEETNDNSEMIQSLPSPTLTAISMAATSMSVSSSTSSAGSWTTSTPELFKHFNMSIMRPVPDSPATRINLSSPLLSSPIQDGDYDADDDGNTIFSFMSSPILSEIKEFDSVVGSTREKDSWDNTAFSKLALFDTIIKEEIEIDNKKSSHFGWNTLGVGQYRGVASSVFQELCR